MPWFIDSIAISGIPWTQRCLDCLRNAHSGPRLQYVDDASFICEIEHGYLLLISALPADGKRTTIKTIIIPQHSGVPKPRLQKKVQGRVDEQVRRAIGALRQHKTTNTNLDFRHSAIRERLDKFDRHIYHHKAMERAAGKKINAAVRVTGHADVDLEAEAICSALESPARVSLCSTVGSAGNLDW